MCGRGLWLTDGSVSSGDCPAPGVGVLPGADESQFLGSRGKCRWLAVAAAVDARSSIDSGNTQATSNLKLWKCVDKQSPPRCGKKPARRRCFSCFLLHVCNHATFWKTVTGLYSIPKTWRDRRDRVRSSSSFPKKIPRLVGRWRSEVRVSASFQIFA